MRPAEAMTRTYKENISIHAPRVGCDIRPYGLARPSIHFNPRTPGGVRPIYDLCVSLYQLEFQSTHPGWGATRGTLAISKAGLIFQSTHPGWGATAFVAWKVVGIIFQSTHPGWGATLCIYYTTETFGRFQSTHPGWGATYSQSIAL